MTTAILIPQKQLDRNCEHDGLVLILKADGRPDPLTEDGFLEYESELVSALQNATKEPAEALLAAFSEIAQEAGLGPLARRKTRLRVNRALKAFADQMLEVAPDIAGEAQAEIARESVKTLEKRQVQKSGDPDKEREFYRRSSAMFMGAYFRDSMPERAQYALTKAYNENRDKPDEEKLDAYRNDLESRLGKLADAPDNYYQVFSANALNNARTYSQLNYFDQHQDVIAYRIKSVVDSSTTNICRSLNGRVFPIKKALNQYERLFQAQSLDEVRQITPMAYGTEKKGFYIGSGDKRQSLDIQDYNGLISAGVFFPPFHFNCRSTVVPVYGLLEFRGVALDEGAEDFERQAQLREYAFHLERIKRAEDRMLKLLPGNPKATQAQINAVRDAMEDVALSIAEFKDVPNYESWKREILSQFELMLKPMGESTFKEEQPRVMGRLLELKSAHWLRGNNHNVLGFNIKILSETKIEPNSSDIDILSFKDKTIFDIQVKYTSPSAAKNRKQNRRSNQQMARHMLLFRDPDLLKYKAKDEVKAQKSIYEKIHKTQQIDKAESIVVTGIPDPLTSSKKRYSGGIIKESVSDSVSAMFVRNVDDLDSDLVIFK